MDFIHQYPEWAFYSVFFICHKPLMDLILACNTQKLNLYHFEEDLFSRNLSIQKNRVIQYFLKEWLPALVISILLYFLIPTWKFNNGQSLHWLVVPVCMMFAWKYLTTDNDAGTGENKNRIKIILLLSTLATSFSPAFLALFLNIGFYHFRSWQHHNQMPTRLIQITLTALFINSLFTIFLKVNYSFITCYTLLLLLTWAMHYWAPFAQKIFLSLKNRKIWPIANDLHLIIRAAQFYGWKPGKKSMDFLYALVKRYRILLQICTLIGEGIVLFALFDFRLSVFSICFMTLMHVIIVLCSGIFFWEYMTTNLLIVFFLSSLSHLDTGLIFTQENGLIFIFLSFAFVLSGLILWRPKGLAWWETNLVGKINWTATGLSGQKYPLTNRFLDPHEYAFGRFFGDFLLKRPVLYYHLGQVKSFKHKAALASFEGNILAINQYVNQNGKDLFDSDKKQMHDLYLMSFFQNINKNFPKKSPWFLPNWLKAPGGQLYYLGSENAFNFQEKIIQLEVSFSEKIWIDEQWITTYEAKLYTLEIPE
ncbi:MAG TPA: hypothetical protein PLZ32_06050 [Saprospiraceae bacterium]|nr:hypothetical protein [Saprospiraceae bacterium]